MKSSDLECPQREEIKQEVVLTKKQNVIQVTKFIIFSISAGVIQLITFTLLNETLDLPYWPCYLTALILSVFYNFTINRRFTFKAANNVPIAMLKVAAYYLVFTPLSTVVGNYLTEDLFWNEYIVLGLTMLVNLSTEFLYSRYVTFRGSINTNDLGVIENEKYNNTK